MSQQFYSDDEEYDNGFDEDMEALRRACTLAGTNLDEACSPSSPFSAEVGRKGRGGVSSGEGEEVGEDDDDDDDFELFRNIRNRFSIPITDLKEPLSLKPLSALPPDFEDDDEDKDFETLRSIQRRFAAYDNIDILGKRVENLAGNTKACKVFPDSEECDQTTNLLLTDAKEIRQSGPIECDLPSLWSKDSSTFPKSAQEFLVAIKRNRSSQKFLRTKLAQVEARIEESKKLKERVKLFRDFQVSCRKVTGRALAQGKDPRIQLISARRTLSSKESKVNDNGVSAMHNGPVENSHVVNYRTALENYPFMFKYKKWTEAEKENLRKGMRQQFQETVLQFSVEKLSGSEGSLGDVNNFDAVLSSIRDLEITPEMLREFLPKVNWDQLASLYVSGRTGAECEAQWLNCEDSLINHSKWTAKEEKKLLFIIQEKGMTNWFDIAASLGSGRTPFQCLAHYQRALNAHIIKSSDWTNEEDAQLRAAVETFGENDWQSVASTLMGRTGTQCSNRWKKTLHPNICRQGRWTIDESKRLKVAVMLFGPKNWGKIAHFLPGRTGPQCRERWFNCLDPSLKGGNWTEEEDSRLKAAIEECGYCWAKVAKCLPPRTDSECLRRWKVLFPDEVPLLQAARRIRKTAIISNFVDRESERPALGPHDFIPLPMIRSISGAKDENISRKPERKTRSASGKNQKAALRNSSKSHKSRRHKDGMQIPKTQPVIHNGTGVEEFGGNDTVVTKRRIRPRWTKNCHTEPAQDDRCKGSKFGGKYSSKKVLYANHEDNVALASVPGQDGYKRLKSCAKSVLDMNDEDSVTLASFVASLPCQHDAHKKSKVGSKYRLKRVLDTNAEDNATLGSFVASDSCKHDGHKRSEVRSKSCSKRVLETNDEDNDTLASLFKNKSKKRRIQVFENDKSN